MNQGSELLCTLQTEQLKKQTNPPGGFVENVKWQLYLENRACSASMTKENKGAGQTEYAQSCT